MGAYQAGAYAALAREGGLVPSHIAGASVGAVNAALIAGGPREEAVDRLQRFWRRAAAQENPFLTPMLAPYFPQSWRHAESWASALQTRLFGRSGLFRPRLPEILWRRQPSLYDLGPLRGTIEEFVDFDWLNDGAVRISIAATDVETGEAVLFDTARGERIGVDHLMASCGFLPAFPPTEIGGHAFADAGFAANAPVEAVLNGEADREDLLCFVVDLFSSHGIRPDTVEAAASRQWELLFGNQSREKLERLEREWRLRHALGALAEKLGPDFEAGADIAALLPEGRPRAVNVLHLAYRPRSYEAGPEKGFDFSQGTLGDRWKVGIGDMEAAIVLAKGISPRPGFFVHRIESALESDVSSSRAA